MNWKEHLLRTLARLGLWRPGNLHYIGGSDVLPAPLSREEAVSYTHLTLPTKA